MKAMVLAAGFGTRLRPHTKLVPKPALPVFDQPLLYWTLAQLVRAGVTEVCVNAHFRAEQIEELCRNHPFWNLKVTVSIEQPDILGTSGGLGKVREFFRDSEPFLMVNSDILHSADLAQVVRFHKWQKATATMMLYRGPGSEKYPYMGTTSDGDLSMFINKEISRADTNAIGCFTGIHVFNEEVFEYIPREMPSEINTFVYPRMIRDGMRLCGVYHDGFWSDLGTLQDFLHAHHWGLGEGREQLHTCGYLGAMEEQQGWMEKDACYIAPTAEVADSATISPQSVVMAGACVGEGVHIDRSVVLPGTVVPDGRVVREEVVGPATEWT